MDGDDVDERFLDLWLQSLKDWMQMRQMKEYTMYIQCCNVLSGMEGKREMGIEMLLRLVADTTMTLGCRLHCTFLLSNLDFEWLQKCRWRGENQGGWLAG